MISQVSVNYQLETLRAIAASPNVNDFIIGYTANPAQRQKQYRSVNYNHFIILAAGMTREDALSLEKRLQDAVKADPTDILYRKYDSDRREMGHSKSYGGVLGNPSERTHAVYMAWGKKGII